MGQEFQHGKITDFTLVEISKGFVLDNFEKIFAKDKDVFTRLKKSLAKKLFKKITENQKLLVFKKTDVDTDKFVDESSLEALNKIVIFSSFSDSHLFEYSATLRMVSGKGYKMITVKDFEIYDF